ncbi:lamin tail domain-containing protein [bacterium]|nr:lamin tail domain-containing protein [bacterium]
MALNRSVLALSKHLRFVSRKALKRRQIENPCSQYSVLEPRNLLAAIAWSSGDITADSDVSINGTPVFAISGSAGAGSVTVNGVNFLHSTRSSAASLAQGQSPGGESISTTIGNDNTASFETGGLGDIGQIIRGGWFNTLSGSTASVNLTGLTIGDVYEVQLFVNDARTGRDDGYVASLDNGVGGVGIDLSLNNQPNGGSAGDFGIGTFTADATSQSFEMSGFINGNESPGRIQVNAIQLRRLDAVELLPGSHPLINEFSASNAGAIDDDNGNSTDWIEIYNAGEDAINLVGYTLTDNPTDTTKYVFPSTTLPGGQYLVVFAGDDADPTIGTDLYTGFALSSSGEYLGFFDPAGNLVSEFGPGGSDYPAQFTDVSYGLVADNNFDTSTFFATPTPGYANFGSVDGVINESPTVSVERGFYEQAFDVEIASQTPGASVVYTTDGSEPSLSNGTRVDPADGNSTVAFTLNISQTTSLRTAAVKDGFATLAATTHTYVFVEDVITSDVLDTTITSQYSDQFLKDALLDIPTLSFNYDTDITDSFIPEQAASIEWLAPDGSEGFQIDAGIRAFGGYHSSSQRFVKKNFRVEFRNRYGASQLEFPLFEGFDNGITPTESFDSVEFRTGSHDRFQLASGQAARFVDDTLLEAGHVAPHGRFVHIYTNGVYWGQYHMRERWDADFLAQYYGGQEDDYEATNGNHTSSDNVALNGGIATPNNWSPGEPYDGDGVAWDNITVLADTAGDGNPEGPTGGYQELKEVVNLEQYLDFTLIYMTGGVENEFRAGGSIDGSVPYTFYLNDPDRWLRTTSDRTGNAGAGNILGTLLEEGDPEFMTLFTDRIQHLFGEGGVLSAERSTARLQARLDETAMSYVLESARYERFDEAKTPAQFTADLNTVLEDILPQMQIDMVNRLRARGYFPDFDAPSFIVEDEFQNGGPIESGDLLTLDATNTIYYTVDGTDPRLVGGGINPNALFFNSGVTSTQLFPEGSDWKYFDQYTSLDNEDWTNSSYDDSQWAENQSELGYGDNDVATTIGYSGTADNKSITTYFRKTFSVAAGTYSSASLNVHFDDGVAVYLNGVEIGRQNLAAGATFTTTASSTADTDFTFNFDPGLLVDGNNTLAVEIHQASGTSSDISFNASLSVTDDTSSTSPPITLNTSTNVQARTFQSGQWSGLSNAVFTLPASQSDLRISEIYYNPSELSATESDAGFDDNDEFEFIEIINSHPSGTINLDGVQLNDGVTYEFGDIDLLPEQRVVVVKNATAFRFRYGNEIAVVGQYSGGLNNGGEELAIVDADLNEIMSVNFGDADPWYLPTDGQGFSLVLDDAFNTPAAELGKYYSWRSSTELGGTPGAASTQPLGVVINEVLAHTDAPQSDSIELFNPLLTSINIGGWYLSDQGDDLLKFQIPAGTVLSAGGYVVFDEADFNPNPLNPAANDFALSGSNGDQVYLSQASSGTFTSLQDAVEFNATFNGDSLGRLPNGTGRLTRLASNSLGSSNSNLATGPLVISEFNYHPADPSSNTLAIDPTLTADDLEFIEITNPTGAIIDLTDWRIRGEVDFDFGAGLSLAAGASIVVVSFDPSDSLNASKTSAFRSAYGISNTTYLVGGFDGGLSNSSGRISLQQPDAPDMIEVSRVVVDEVVYDDLAPWNDADGSGDSLTRKSAFANANYSSSWEAVSPTPGVSDLVLTAAPQVAHTTRDEGGVLGRPDLLSSYSVTFDQHVNVSSDELFVSNDTMGFEVDVSSINFTYDAATLTATWDFNNLVLDASFYTFELADTITNVVGGLALDGDRDEVGGGNYIEDVYVAIPGDANLDGDVEVNDINLFLGTNTGDGATLLSNLDRAGTFTWSEGDFNSDGDVDSSQLNLFTGEQNGDYAIFLANLGRSVRPVGSQPVTLQPVTPQPVISQPVISQPVISQPVVSQAVAATPVALPVFQAVQSSSTVAEVIDSTTSAEKMPFVSMTSTSSVTTSESVLFGAQANVDVLNDGFIQLAFASAAKEVNGPLVASVNSSLELGGAHELIDGIFSEDIGDDQSDADEEAADDFTDAWRWPYFA